MDIENGIVKMTPHEADVAELACRGLSSVDDIAGRLHEATEDWLALNPNRPRISNVPKLQHIYEKRRALGALPIDTSEAVSVELDPDQLMVLRGLVSRLVTNATADGMDVDSDYNAMSVSAAAEAVVAARPEGIVVVDDRILRERERADHSRHIQVGNAIIAAIDASHTVE